MRSPTATVPMSCNSPPSRQRLATAWSAPRCSAIATARSETRSASTCGRPARALDESVSARASRIGSGSSATRSSTVRSPNSCTRSRPRRLAAASARPAQSTSPSTERSASPARTAPIETVTGSSDVVVDRDGQRPDEAADLLGQPAQHLVVGHAGREHDELLAAPAAEHVVAAQPALQARGDLAQHAIADGVPVDVVDAPEVVEVEHHHARRHARALAARELGGDRVEHVAAVVEAGQRVGARAPLGLGAAALGLEQRPLLVAAPLAQRDRRRRPRARARPRAARARPARARRRP